MGRGWKKDAEKKGNRESGGRLARENASRCTLLHTSDPSTSIPTYRSPTRKSSRGKDSSVVDCVSTEKSRPLEKFEKKGFDRSPSCNRLLRRPIPRLLFSPFSFFLSRYCSKSLLFHSSRKIYVM